MFWNECRIQEFIKPQNLGSLLIKSSQSNFIYNPQVRSYLITTVGYSRIKIDHITDSLLKLQIKIGVNLINVELSQLLTLGWNLVREVQFSCSDLHFLLEAP